MNGVVNFSVLDGWWLEGYRPGAGWALTEKRTYQNQDYQDQLDAATIYSILENEIVPLYYNKNAKGYSEGWIQVVKNSIAQIAPHYTMKRQLDDYYTKFYNKLGSRFAVLSANDNAKAKEIAAWKETVAERWDGIEVVSATNIADLDVTSGTDVKLTVVLDEKGLDNAVGVEVVTIETDSEGKEHINCIDTLELVKKDNNIHTFEGIHNVNHAGTFKVAYRMYPKNADLPHRQDFCYVRWF
jgi:starch phosphorylase